MLLPSASEDEEEEEEEDSPNPNNQGDVESIIKEVLSKIGRPVTQQEYDAIVVYAISVSSKMMGNEGEKLGF